MKRVLYVIYLFVFIGIFATTVCAEILAQLEQKAQTGDAAAQYELALIYSDTDEAAFDYVKAFEWMLKSAEQDYAPAQSALGVFYYYGRGPIESDCGKAMEWLNKAAEQDLATAQFNLGMLYCTINDCTKYDYYTAKDWLAKAAAQEHLDAQWNLGLLLVKQWSPYAKEKMDDYNTGMQWLYKAADRDSAYAQFHIGTIFKNGVGMDNPDNVKAAEWLRKAAANGLLTAQVELAEFLLVNKELGSEDARHTEAHKWLLLAAKQDDITALWRLANIYRYGNSVTAINYDSALGYARRAAALGNEYSAKLMRELYHEERFPAKTAEIIELEKLAENGDAEAQFQYGKLFAEGNFVKPSDNTAFYWYQKAAAQGNLKAMNNLGVFYMRGQGTPKDYKQALKWISKAAEKDHPTAQNNLGYMYEWGIGVPENWTKSFKWYEKAALNGFPLGMDNLGFMYETGTGTDRDYAKAVEWYTKGAEAGSTTACFHLTWMYKEGKGVPQSEKEADKWFDRFHEIKSQHDFHETDTASMALGVREK